VRSFHLMELIMGCQLNHIASLHKNKMKGFEKWRIEDLRKGHQMLRLLVK